MKIELKHKRFGRAWTEFIELRLEKLRLAFVYVVINFGFHNVRVDLLILCEKLLGFREDLSCMELFICLVSYTKFGGIKETEI